MSAMTDAQLQRVRVMNDIYSATSSARLSLAKAQVFAERANVDTLWLIAAIDACDAMLRFVTAEVAEAIPSQVRFDD